MRKLFENTRFCIIPNAIGSRRKKRRKEAFPKKGKVVIAPCEAGSTTKGRRDDRMSMLDEYKPFVMSDSIT